MNDNQQKIDEIVTMLDGFMSDGGGHMNITENTLSDAEKQVTTLGCLDCAAGDMACAVPTLHKGIDDEEEA